jgi:ABC-2 type transporter
LLRHPDAGLEHGPTVRAALQHGRILQRIGVQDEQVGDRARTDPAQVVTSEQLRVDRGSGPEHSQRSLDLGLQPQPVELLVVQRAHQVGPEPDPDPRLPGQPDRRPSRVEDLAVLGLGIPAVIGGFALFLLFSYALSWGGGCLGILSKGPESAQGVGLVILFPLAIVSNGLVPTQRMPAVLRVIADWNPVSAVTAAARHLWGNPNPSATIHAWPMQHPVAASLLWSVALLVIFAPLAALLYRRRTTG